MAQYRLLEIRDTLINNGKPYWQIQKKWLFWWSSFFSEHDLDSATYYSREEAERWFNYHAFGIREEIKILQQV